MPNSAGVDAHSLDQALTRLRLMYAKPEHPFGTVHHDKAQSDAEHDAHAH